MSSLIPQPPPSIQVGGGGAPGGADPDGAQDAKVVPLLKQALSLVNQAATVEGDDIDAANLHKLAASISAAIASEQKLTDDVMGGGPGVKMVRKAAQGPAT